ncbi:hypothetical protein FA15DRAFT_760565 [Coprinopsis marcescibilis]|uniref:Uncharacterized protein n=1 Tax=Coprinopsis marcescibilis TaxID=230819 RepID=A0A5C3KFV4_COPMA|nr:hypothetical protein FA15DRAFT_760565 [Coprinopsis marcescibilis]
MLARRRAKSRELVYALHRFIHQTSLPTRPVNVSATGYRSPPPRKRVISTLDRAKLQPSDYLDISGLSNVSAGRRKPSSDSAQRAIVFSYYADRPQSLSGEWIQHKFPVSTRGFLYWHDGYPSPPCSTPSSTPTPAARPDVSTPSTTSSIRFSLISTPRPSKVSTEGQDLLTPNGVPWKIPVKSILTKQAYKPLCQMLVDDGLIPCSLVEAVDTMKRSGSAFAKMGEPFLCDLRAKTVLMKYGVDCEGKGEGMSKEVGERAGEGEGEGEVYSPKVLLMLNLTGDREAADATGYATGYAGLAILQLHCVTDAPPGYLGKSTVPLTEHELLEPVKKKPKSPLVLFVLKVVDILTQAPSHPSTTTTKSRYPPPQTPNSLLKTYDPDTQTEDIWTMSKSSDYLFPEVWEGLGEVEWEYFCRARREARGEVVYDEAMIGW